MKKLLYVNLLFILIITVYSCTVKESRMGDWEDNIKLSVKAVEFSSAGDSVTIKTGGSWWNIGGISVDSTNYYDFPGVNRQAVSYTLKKDCFDIQRRDNHTLFIKVLSNPLSVKRIITVGLEAGDYFDSVTITQKAK
jgi:hypothetical protein